MSNLTIENLSVNIEEKEILKGFNLSVPSGEVHAIMGPNGTGKSTLAKALAGHEDYEITGGSAKLGQTELVGMEADEISLAGLFLAFQYPCEIAGVTIANFIRAALQARQADGERFDAVAYYNDLYEKMDALGMNRDFTARSVNEGFSGGEKKRCEILQMMMLEPSFAVLDETDSGLDIDALKVVAQGVNAMRSPERGFLIITHYQRLLDYIKPDVVHVMHGGQIVKSGGPELAHQLEAEGYEWVKDLQTA